MDNGLRDHETGSELQVRDVWLRLSESGEPDRMEDIGRMRESMARDGEKKAKK